MSDDIWDSDSVLSDTKSTCAGHSNSTNTSTSKCDSFPNGAVMLGKNVPLIKDDEQGVLKTDSFREYLEKVEDFEDLRSMFISMILDLKERVKGCEHCETCSQVIELVEENIRICKKVSKLAHGFANVFMHIVNRAIPNKLNDNAKHQLNVAFILLVKNSKFPDVQFIYENFKAFINIDAFEGLALRLAIQKYKPADIRIMLKEWGCNPTVRGHRPIIRAFYYEKFGVVRNLIELGSSYKYYLQEDLSPIEYQTFQKAIDKYLATQYPDSCVVEKQLHIVKMIKDFHHILKEDDAKAAAECNEPPDDDYNPIATEYFLEDFMQYFYDTTGTTPLGENKNKKKKKKNKKKSKPKSVAEPMDTPNALVEHLPSAEQPTQDNNLYNAMNDETFIDSIEKDNNYETILLDTYYTDMTTTTVQKNQIHLGNWKSSCAAEYSTESSIYWDRHFRNIFTRYPLKH